MNDTSPSTAAARPTTTASSSSTRRREKWDGRVQLRASSLRQKIDRERTQRQSMAASISTRQLRGVAIRRAKLLTLQARLEQECRDEMEREAGEKLQVEGEHNGDGHYGYSGDVVERSRTIGRRQDRPSSRKVSTRKKADSDSSGTKAISSCTHRRQKENALVCSPKDDIPYLQFITRKIERENEDEDDSGKQEQEQEHQEREEEVSRRYAHASTPPTKTDHSSPVSFADDASEVGSSADKGGDALNTISRPSTAYDLATKVQELEERLKRLGSHTDTHSSESIGVSKDEHSDKSGANDTSRSIDNISKGGDAEGLLGSFESTFGDDDYACKDSFLSTSEHRPRPPVLLVPHQNDAIHPSLTHSRPSVTTIDTSSPAEQSIGFEGFVLGSLIDSIP